MSLFGDLLHAGEGRTDSLFSSENIFARRIVNEELRDPGAAGPSRGTTSRPDEAVGTTERRKRRKLEPQLNSDNHQSALDRDPSKMQSKGSKRKQDSSQQEALPEKGLQRRHKQDKAHKDVPAHQFEQPGANDAPAGEAAEILRDEPNEAEQLSRTVFVGNLPVNVKRKTLKALFAMCGEVDSVRLRSVPLKLDKMLPRRAAILSNHVSSEMGPSKAYVVFKEEGSVQNAMSLNMKEVEGHHIRVDRAGQHSKGGQVTGKGVDYDKASSIFVGNLPFDVTDEEVIRLFKDDLVEGSSVEAVRIVRDPATNIGKGFGYVLFSDKNAARMALAKDSLKLRNRPLRVTRVVKTLKKAGATTGTAYKGITGAAGRLSRKKGSVKAELPSTSWQGLQTKKGKAPKSVGAAKAGTGGQGMRQQKKPASKLGAEARKSKRPAVAARKARALGLPIPTTPKQKKKGGKSNR